MAKVIQPSTLVQSLVIYAFIDSIEIYFGLLKPHQRRALRRYCRVERTLVRYNKKKRREYSGWRAIVTRPSELVVKRLDRLVRKYHGVCNRLDVALEISSADHRALHSLIESHIVLRWRKPGPMGEKGETIYWEPLRRGKRCRRNLVVYSDKINRVTGEVDCTHLELRLMRAYLIRKQGIHRLTDLFQLDPSKLFAHHIAWTNAADVYVQKVLRAHVDEDRKQYAGRRWVKPWEDRYRAGLPRRVRRVLNVLQLDRAQIYKDTFRNRTAIKLRSTGLAIPQQLEWGVIV